MNLAKNFASRREILSRFPSRSRFYFGCQGSCRDSRKHPGEIFAAEKLLPGENLDEIRGRIPARFWPPRFSLPGENHGEIRGRIPARFWPPRFLLPGENHDEIRGRIPARFWPPRFSLPGENHGKIRGRIPARFWPPGISLPGENLAGIPPGFPPREKNPGGQNLAAIPAGFPSRSQRDPAKIPVLILQGLLVSCCLVCVTQWRIMHLCSGFDQNGNTGHLKAGKQKQILQP